MGLKGVPNTLLADRRVHDYRNTSRNCWKWPRWAACGRSKPRPAIKTIGTQLLAGVVENAETSTHDHFSAWCGLEYVCCTDPRRKVVPSGLPKGRALRRERPSVGRPLNDVRVRCQSLRHARRGVYLPA